MTSGYRNSSGVDFDDVFDPYVQGTKPGATGYRTSDGVDLNQRYAPLSFGTAAAVQGCRLSGGADVNTLWAAKGTASYYTPITAVTIGGNPDVNHGSSTTLTASANGSSTSKTYAWSKQSGAATLNISGSSTSASVTIADSALPAAGDTTAVFRCVVSDGTSSAYADATVSGIGTA